MSERFNRIAPESLNGGQRQVFDAIASGPRRSVPLIFQVLLESPELADDTQRLGALLRYRSGLPRELSEVAILTVAHYWHSAYEWSHHEREALAAGVSQASIAAIGAGDRGALGGDEALIHDFAQTLLRGGDVPDALFSGMSARFGRQALLMLTGLVGYYSMLALVARAFRLEREDQA